MLFLLVIDYEMTFLRIIESITNGSFIQINYTGTVVRYKPGLIVGGTHSFKVPKSRGMGYFLEPLLLLAPFGKVIDHHFNRGYYLCS